MTTEQKTERIHNRMKSAEAIASQIQEHAPEALPYTARVGKWLWITFPSKPQSKTLAAIKQMGFSWNPRRNAWQNPCGVFRRRNVKIDPREVYGEEPLTVS